MAVGAELAQRSGHTNTSLPAPGSFAALESYLDHVVQMETTSCFQRCPPRSLFPSLLDAVLVVAEFLPTRSGVRQNLQVIQPAGAVLVWQ